MVKGEFTIVGIEKEPTARRFVGSKREVLRHRFRLSSSARGNLN